MKVLTAENIDYLAIGAAVLGAGGGGDPYLGKLMAKQALLEKGEIPLLDPDDIPDDELVIPSAMMGAPAVMLEKLPNGGEPEAAFRAVESSFGRKAYAVLPIEAGGINSCIPVYTAAKLGLPLVDADGMGRAFPEIQMVTYTIGGVSASPMVCCDEKGNKVLITYLFDKDIERLFHPFHFVPVIHGTAFIYNECQVHRRKLFEAKLLSLYSYLDHLLLPPGRYLPVS